MVTGLILLFFIFNVVRMFAENLGGSDYKPRPKPPYDPWPPAR